MVPEATIDTTQPSCLNPQKVHLLHADVSYSVFSPQKNKNPEKMTK